MTGMKNEIKRSARSIIPAMAFRNLLRNRQRTLLSGSTIALVALVVCLIFALEEGAVSDMKNNVINDVTGNIRIRAEQYSENERIQPLRFFIPDTERLSRQIEGIDGVTGTEQRITAAASIYKDDKIETAILTGVPYGRTRLFSNRSTVFIEGSSSDIGKGQKTAVITQTLSDVLNLHVGDKLTFFTRTAAGGSNGATLTVAAVVHLGDTDFNSMRCFMDWRELSGFLRMDGNASEIFVYTRERLSGAESAGVVQSIQALLKSTSAGVQTPLEVLPWKKTGVIYALFDFMDTVYFFIAVVFFLLASTVIFNTTMMSVLERRKEIGTLMSLGMDKYSIFGMILLEICMTAGAAALAGCAAAAVIINIWHTHGYNMYAAGGSAVGGMNLSAWIYPSLAFFRYVLVFATGVCIAAAACTVPARQAMKVEPAEALRAEN
jgi:putative ABC transport system permease protein